MQCMQCWQNYWLYIKNYRGWAIRKQDLMPMQRCINVVCNLQYSRIDREWAIIKQDKYAVHVVSARLLDLYPTYRGWAIRKPDIMPMQKCMNTGSNIN